jgi:hypothetical protein
MSELVASISLHFVAGDDLLLEFTVTRDDVAVNITGMTARFVVARRPGETAVLSTEASPATATASLTTPASGIFRVAIDGANSSALRGTYQFEAEIEDGSGDISTVARGFVTFEAPLIG